MNGLKSFLASLTLLIGFVSSAADPFAPVAKCDLTTHQLCGQESVSYTFEPEAIGFEVNLSFKQNTSIEIDLGNSNSLTLHLSDKKVNHDPSDPFYILEVNRAGHQPLSYKFENIGTPNNFVALKFINGELSLGNRKLEKVGDFELPLSEFLIAALGNATLTRMIVFYPPWRPEIEEGFSRETWTMMDEEIDLDYSMIGGNYELATINEGDTIKLIYLSGATIYPDEWKPGMLKGVATKSNVNSTYNLRWIDAEFDDGAHRAYMKIEGDIMTLSFPYGNATLHFVRKK